MSNNLLNLMVEMKRTLELIEERLASLQKPLRIDEKRRRITELDQEMEAPDFWNDQERAGKLQKNVHRQKKQCQEFDEASLQASDYLELLELAKEEPEAAEEIEAEVKALEQTISSMELKRMLGGPNDKNNAILNINVGAGGVDSQDFAEMLLRMYTRYAESRGYGVENVEYQPGEEAGIKSATIVISGEYAYGYLKAEVGVHRLVRISPFDAQARRHTSFASVWVLPEISDDIDIEIKTEDLRVDTLRAGGAGGQHVNKTESAVRLTHLPTNIVVLCQAERSQLKNRNTAMKLLKAKLYDHEMRQKLAAKDKAEAAKMEASFGSQIRNYVLAPYRLAKDLRSGYETGNVDNVLDGDLQPMIEAFLLSENENADS